MTIQKFMRSSGKNKSWQALFLIAGALVACVLGGCVKKEAPPRVVKEVTAKKTEDFSEGYFLGKDVEQKAYVERMESQYHALTGKDGVLEKKAAATDEKMDEMKKTQSKMLSAISALEEKLVFLSDQTSRASGESVPSKNYQLDVIQVNAIDGTAKDAAYLPAGSFVRGRLLTGVYAPEDQNNPLPVLIRLEEAFYGPNETRVPLEGAFVLGKAVGDLNSERALIQAVTVSAVFPSGETEEVKGNIGYVTDAYGQLGVKGRVVRNTGAALTGAFISGFLGGAAQGFSDGETSAVAGARGTVARNVTGDKARYAAFQGASQSALKLSKYYEDGADKIVPAVKVDAGTEVVLVVLEGVRIHGLKSDRDRVVGRSGYFD